ncbi:MAG: hypothetical protein WD049_03465 [Candidatus Paceibacterota bacterium]
MNQWNFSKIRPGDKTREPIQGEFFTSDAIGRNGEALVREGIQNAMDAAIPGQRVHVRLFVSGESFGVPHDTMAEYCDGLWEHLHSPGNGLQNPPSPTEPCPFIVFEDFGTTGLQGDVEQYHPEPGVRNPFYYFVRAEGRSDKGEHERGRWGVGKFVFPSASRANTTFCATVRADDQRQLIIGQSVLKTHKVAADYYTPDGFFGQQLASGLTVPIENERALRSFFSTFNLQRRPTDPGLSIVIPWHDPDITSQALLAATALEYFFPILAGRLTVTVETPDQIWKIDQDTLQGIIDDLGSDELGDLSSYLPLAKAACNGEEPICLTSPSLSGALRWSEDMVSVEDREQINSRLENGSCVAVRVPMTVRRKSGANAPSHFDLYLQRDPTSKAGRPIFVRESIIISDVQAPRLRGIRSLVVVEDGPLATLLGDAENPSHTRWENGSNFKNKYVYGKSHLTFVANATSELLRILSDPEEEADRTLLSDFFFVPTSGTESGVGGGKTKTRLNSGTPTPDIPPPRPPRIRVERSPGGFAVIGANSDSPPASVDVRVAYDVRRGSALKNYDRADFEIGKGGVRVVAEQGVTVTECESNRLSLNVNEAGFRCAVAGFDTERDLYVDARAKDVVDDH